mmetsp:Transcript_21715/g.45674  ORF Transcript_21715/g.45674 Transcript_21715/m.45674 type:complete len:201 (-) Transcript_21715:346-948(-)
MRFSSSSLSLKSSDIFFSLASAITCTSCKFFFSCAASSLLTTASPTFPLVADETVGLLMASDDETTAAPSGEDTACFRLFIPSIMAIVSMNDTPLSSFSTALSTSSIFIRPQAILYNPLRTRLSEATASFLAFAISSSRSSFALNCPSNCTIFSFNSGTECDPLLRFKEGDVDADEDAAPLATRIISKIPSLNLIARLAT